MKTDDITTRPLPCTQFKTQIRPGVWALVAITVGEMTGEDRDFEGEPAFRQPDYHEVMDAVRNIEAGDAVPFDHAEEAVR